MSSIAGPYPQTYLRWKQDVYLFARSAIIYNFEWYPWIMPRLMQHHCSERLRIVLGHPWISLHPTDVHHQAVVSGFFCCKIFHWSKIDMRSKWQGSDKNPESWPQTSRKNLVSTTSHDDVLSFPWKRHALKTLKSLLSPKGPHLCVCVFLMCFWPLMSLYQPTVSIHSQVELYVISFWNTVAADAFGMFRLSAGSRSQYKHRRVDGGVKCYDQPIQL